MRNITAWLMITVAILGVSAYAAKNSNKEQAESLVKEGKSLEDQGKLLEALAKYNEAAKFNGGRKELAELNKKIVAKTGEIVTAAKASFEAKDYAKSIEQLKEAKTLAPGNADVNCDLGVSYHAAGDDPNAVESLHTCIGEVKKPEEKSRYEQLITQIDTKDNSPITLDAGQKQALTEFNQNLKQNEETLPTTTEDAELCKNLLDKQAMLPKTPSILFNLAKCSEDAGKLEDAARYFADYLKAAPDSRVVPEAKDASSVLQSILAFDGAKRDEVRAHYSSAAQYLVKGRYSLALKEYEAVRDLVPEFAYGHRQLGLFYEALGRTDDAARELNAYAAMDNVPADEKDWASKEVAGLADRRAKYDAAVSEAIEKVRPLLFTGHSGADGKVSDEAIQKLQAATSEFALAPEANHLLGFLYVEADYPAGAKRGYDAATSSGADPFFFAWVTGIKDVKGSVFSLIQVKKDGLQIEPILTPDLKKRKKTKGPLTQSAGDTKPASCNSVVTSKETLVPQAPCGIFLAVKDIHHIESRQVGIEVANTQKTIWMVPLNLFQGDPVQYGPAARKFENRYTRVIQRYMENDITKLGAEHMTGGEKTAMGFMIASAAMGGVGGALNAISAASAAINVSMAAIQAMAVVQQMRMQNAALARRTVYRPIPVDPAPLAFRVD